MTSEPRTRPIEALLGARVLDAELAALLWLLVEARTPVLVAGPPGKGRRSAHDALLALLPDDSRPAPLAGEAEDFEWLPEAIELGWRRERPTSAPRPTIGRASPANTVLVADLDDRSPDGTWGPRARIAIRALALGYGLAATMEADGLDDVLARLKAPPVSADDDELSRLGLVLVVQEVGPGLRIVAAHYLRPVARDPHGHVQRLPPAVLATWNPATDRFEHFAWGVLDELADRTGRRPIELEREQARRAARLTAPG